MLQWNEQKRHYIDMPKKLWPEFTRILYPLYGLQPHTPCPEYVQNIAGRTDCSSLSMP